MKKALSIAGLMLLATAVVPRASVAAGWVKTQYTSKGQSFDQYLCMPASKGPNPAVVIIHGAETHEANYDEYERECMDLAAQGYVGDFVEYYGPGEEVVPGETEKIKAGFFAWNHRLRDAIDTLDKNPAVDPKRVGEIGYSLGALLALEHGAHDPNQIAAIVEYYGAAPKGFEELVSTVPPILIIHGGRDQIVNAKQAQALDQMLTAANRPHEIKIYPEARHAFNMPSDGNYDQNDAQDAWGVTLTFLGKYLNPSH